MVLEFSVDVRSSLVSEFNAPVGCWTFIYCYDYPGCRVTWCMGVDQWHGLMFLPYLALWYWISNASYMMRILGGIAYYSAVAENQMIVLLLECACLLCRYSERICLLFCCSERLIDCATLWHKITSVYCASCIQLSSRIRSWLVFNLIMERYQFWVSNASCCIMYSGIR